jgi:hypothetical protein
VVLVFLASGCLGAIGGYPAGNGPVDAAVVDVNGDGHPDIVVANAVSNTLTVRLQGPHGFFDDAYTMQLPKGAQPSGIVAGKFRANGKPTVVVANRGDDSISIFDSFAPGASPTKTLSLGKDAAPAAIALGDVDGDGDQDLLVTSRQPTFPGCEVKGCILVYRDKGNGLAYTYSAYPVGTSRTVDYNPTSISVGEVFGGGRAEIAVVRKGADDALVIETKGEGFEAAASYTTIDVAAPRSVQIGRASTLPGMVVNDARGRYHLFLVKDGRLNPQGTGNGFALLAEKALLFLDPDTGKASMLGESDSKTSPLLKGITRVLTAQLDGDTDVDAVAIAPQRDAITVVTSDRPWSSPKSLDLGSVAVGSTGKRVLTAKAQNVEGWIYTPALTGPDADSFRVEGCGSVGYPGGSCQIAVTFAPTSPGVKHASIVIRDNNAYRTDNISEMAWGRPTIQLTGTATAVTSGGGPSLLSVGTTDDFGKYAEDGGASFFSTLREVGMGVNRMDVLWHAGQTAPDASELGFLDRSIAQAQRSGVRVVLSVYPATARDHDAAQLCAFARSLAGRYPSVNDFVIGNEPNKSDFWSPVDPAAYTRLLATCYDQLHPLGVTVSGGTVSARKVGSGMSPVEFIASMGSAYKALGRSAPVMDKLSFHPYPNPETIGKGVDAGYEWPNAGIPELDRIKQAVEDAFHGTAQPTFAGSLRLALDEVGWQAAIAPQFASLYSGAENAATVDEAAQAQNNAALVQRAACDPLVSDLLFFHLVDQKELASGPTTGGWQSGLLRADLSRRPAFDATRGAIGAGCGGARHAWTPATKVVGGSVTLTATKQQVRVNGRTQQGLKFAIAASSDEGVAWKLTIATAAGKVVAAKQGARTARFDAKNFIAPVLVGSGSYKATFTLSATTNPGRTVSDSLDASNG